MPPRRPDTTSPSEHPSTPDAPALEATPVLETPPPAEPPTPPEQPVSPPANSNTTSPPPQESEFMKEGRAAWERMKNSPQNGWLMGPREETQEVSLLKTPFYIIRDGIRGSIGNVLRRGKEVLSPTSDILKSAWNLISSPFKNPPGKTLFRPGQYLANIPRIVTATGKAVKNLLKAPISATNEAYQDIIQTPIERIDYKVAKVPPKKITGLISRFNNGIANVMGWPLRAVDGVAKWATNWIDDVDDYFGAATQG